MSSGPGRVRGGARPPGLATLAAAGAAPRRHGVSGAPCPGLRRYRASRHPLGKLARPFRRFTTTCGVRVRPPAPGIAGPAGRPVSLPVLSNLALAAPGGRRERQFHTRRSGNGQADQGNAHEGHPALPGAHARPDGGDPPERLPRAQQEAWRAADLGPQRLQVRATIRGAWCGARPAASGIGAEASRGGARISSFRGLSSGTAWKLPSFWSRRTRTGRRYPGAPALATSPSRSLVRRSRCSGSPSPLRSPPTCCAENRRRSSSKRCAGLLPTLAGLRIFGGPLLEEFEVEVGPLVTATHQAK